MLQIGLQHHEMNNIGGMLRKMNVEIYLLELLEEAEEDVKKGKIAPLKDTFEDLRNQLLGKPESFSFI